VTFQSVVNNGLGFGIPGDSFLSGPHRAMAYTLESGSEPNIIGATCYTQVAGTDGEAMAGGTGYFVGILVNSKVYATAGTTSGALAPTMTLPNGTIGELCYMHTGLVVQMTNNASAIGDYVFYNTTTGALSSQTSATPAGGTAIIPGARVILFTVAGDGLAVIELNG
jgi:hypothetical protein